MRFEARVKEHLVVAIKKLDSFKPSVFPLAPHHNFFNSGTVWDPDDFFVIFVIVGVCQFGYFSIAEDVVEPGKVFVLALHEANQVIVIVQLIRLWEPEIRVFAKVVEQVRTFFEPLNLPIAFFKLSLRFNDHAGQSIERLL